MKNFKNNSPADPREFENHKGIQYLEGFFCHHCHTVLTQFSKETDLWKEFPTEVEFWDKRTIYGFSEKIGYEFITGSIGAFCLKMDTIFKEATDISYHPDTINLVKWEEGMSQPVHVDDANGFNWRELSVMLYLNDDYEGGEIYFPNQDFEFKPKANSVVVFPGSADYPHGVKPITKGTRYTLTSFWTTDPSHDCNYQEHLDYADTGQ